MSRSNRLVLGLFSDCLMPDPRQELAGSKVAIEQFGAALRRYRERVRRVELACRRLDFSAVARRAGRWKGIRTHRVSDLVRDVSRLNVSVWHDSTNEVHRPFHLRRLCQARFPITVTHHGFSYQFFLHQWVLRWLSPTVQRFDRLICTSTAARDAITFLLEDTAARFNREFGTTLRFRGQLEVIPLGVNTSFFRPLPQRRSAARRKFGLPDEAFVILWMGRISAAFKADLLPLLQVVRELRRVHRREDVHLLVAGALVDNHGTALRAYAADLGLGRVVKLVTPVQRGDEATVYAAGDVFVSPADSLQEAFGLTPIEALACGVPQVVHDWDGYRDTVVDGETGFRVPTGWSRCTRDLDALSPLVTWGEDHLAVGQSIVGDLRSWFQALDVLVRDVALRKKMGAASRRRALSVYHWRHVIARHEALWAQLADEALHTRVPVSPPTYEEARYFGAFHGYATYEVVDDTVIALTSLGRDVARRRESIPAVLTRWDVIDFDACHDCLTELTRRRSGPYRFADLVAWFARRAPGDHRDRHRRHVLWLLKYGYLQIDPRPSLAKIVK